MPNVLLLFRAKPLEKQLPHTDGKTWKQIAALLEVSLSSIYMSGTHKL
jgi:hypothetical protein